MIRVVRALVAALLVALVTACSVPSIDLTDKMCPCEPGYVCDQVTMKCRLAGDAGGSTSCLLSNPGSPLYMDSFDAATIDSGWVTSSMWSQTGGQLVQTDTNDQLAVALTTHVTQADYRVVVTMAGTAGGFGMGISVRASLSTKAQYDCVWEPGATGVLLWQATNNGGAATTLQTQVGIQNQGGAAEPVTMEVSVSGQILRCCLDNKDATVLVSSPSPAYTNGQPGLVTDRMHASFDNFAVYGN